MRPGRAVSRSEGPTRCDPPGCSRSATRTGSRLRSRASVLMERAQSRSRVPPSAADQQRPAVAKEQPMSTRPALPADRRPVTHSRPVRDEAVRPADRDGHRLRLPERAAAEAADVDMVLVGDSGAMTVLGYPSTVAVTRRRDAGARPRPPAAASSTPCWSRICRSGPTRSATSRRSPPRSGSSRRAARTRSSSSAATPVRSAGRGPSSAPGSRWSGTSGSPRSPPPSLGGYRAQGRTAESALRIASGAIGLQEAGLLQHRLRGRAESRSPRN